MIEYVYGFYTLRIIETVFELQARKRYPYRDIFTMQGTDFVDEIDAYNFSLRTSGDVIFIGETREDKMIAQIVNTANRGSRFTVFSFHPNTPDKCPLEMANAMLRMKIYSGLADAITAVLAAVKCCIQLSKTNDMSSDYSIQSERRIYNVYEYVPTIISLPSDFLQLNGEDMNKAFMETCFKFFTKTTMDKNYQTVPIVEYDYDTRRYMMGAEISDSLYTTMKLNLFSAEDRAELDKVFRPASYITKVIKNSNISITEENILNIIDEHNVLYDKSIDKLIETIKRGV
jgi:pilus assembly protein CpaF